MQQSDVGLWLQSIRGNPEFQEVENRPWANDENRKKSKCIGRDFMKHNPRVLLRFFWSEQKKLLTGIATFGMDAEGPSGGAHGASIALVFDEILAYPVWRSYDEAAFTASLNVSYRKMIPLGSTLIFEARIERQEGRKFYVVGKITSVDSKTIYAEGSGLWIQSPKLASISRVSHL